MQFVPEMIPADVDTYEKLILWACATLEFVARGKDVLERSPSAASGDSGIEFAIAGNGPFVATDKSYRKVYRLSFPLAADAESTAYAMTYQAATEITNANPPANFVA